MQDFDVDAAEEFIQAASVPIVTIFDKDPENQVYVSKFFNSLNAKVPNLPWRFFVPLIILNKLIHLHILRD